MKDSELLRILHRQIRFIASCIKDDYDIYVVLDNYLDGPLSTEKYDRLKMYLQDNNIEWPTYGVHPLFREYEMKLIMNREALEALQKEIAETLSAIN
jgi:hypothetical protein